MMQLNRTEANSERTTAPSRRELSSGESESLVDSALHAEQFGASPSPLVGSRLSRGESEVLANALRILGVLFRTLFVQLGHHAFGDCLDQRFLVTVRNVRSRSGRSAT